MPVLFFYPFQNGFFAPRERQVAPINVKFGIGEGSGPKVRSPVPNFTVIGAEMWNTAPITAKISNYGHLPLTVTVTGDSFALFLRNSQRLYASVGSF